MSEQDQAVQKKKSNSQGQLFVGAQIAQRIKDLSLKAQKPTSAVATAIFGIVDQWVAANPKKEAALVEAIQAVKSAALVGKSLGASVCFNTGTGKLEVTFGTKVTGALAFHKAKISKDDPAEKQAAAKAAAMKKAETYKAFLETTLMKK